MKTIVLSPDRPKFWFVEHKRDRSAASVLLPSIWHESQQQGLRVRLHRLVLGWGTHRWYVCWGSHQSPPSLQSVQVQHDLDDFVSWASKWSKKPWSKKPLERWLSSSEWKTMVAWGGAKYHYSRLVLAREYLMFEDVSRAANSASSPTHDLPTASEDQLDLNISWKENAPSMNAQPDPTQES